jgi:DNA-binding transcriptional regulator YiaG
MKLSNPPTGSELKAIRESFGLSGPKFADLLLTPRNTYYNWENGHRALPAASRAALLMLLHMRCYPEVFRAWTESLPE